jgi:hypothetical protein
MFVVERISLGNQLLVEVLFVACFVASDPENGAALGVTLMMRINEGHCFNGCQYTASLCEGGDFSSSPAP